MNLPTVIRCNLEREYLEIERIVEECKLGGIYPPGLLLDLIVNSYRGESTSQFTDFESIFGDLLTSATDSLAAGFSDDVWAIGDLPRLYQELVMEIYPEVVKKLFTFGNGFSQDHAVEVDSSDPYHTLIYLEFQNERIGLDPSSLETIWRNERAASSI